MYFFLAHLLEKYILWNRNLLFRNTKISLIRCKIDSVECDEVSGQERLHVTANTVCMALLFTFNIGGWRAN